MLSALASVLLLGTLPPPARDLPVRELPGIETVEIAPLNLVKTRFTPPALSASGVILIDVESGEEIMSINADTQRPIASLTKIMTALLLLEHRSLTDIITIPAIAENIGGSTVGLIPGQHMSVGSMLKALLLPSANDAAYVLAAYDGRGVGAFVQSMNERAQTLGLKDTHFANPAGLDHDLQFSTPRDLAWLTLAALRNKTFRTIVATRGTRITTSEGKEYDLKNTNELLHYNEDVYGVKTGTTDAAGECLVVLFTEDDHPYLLVLLKSSDRYTDSLLVLKAVHDAAS